MNIKTVIRDSLSEKTVQHYRRLRHPAVGILRRTEPVSDHQGFDRGTPVGRIYLGQFIEKHKADIAGHVFEIREGQYASSHPELITKLDILDLDPSLPDVTIKADLSDMPHVETGSFNCAIVTHTFEFIWDYRAAIAEIHRVLAPGGVLLSALGAEGRSLGASDFWRFQPAAVSRLFGEQFGIDNVETEVFGNLPTGVACLHGLSIEDIDEKRLFPGDPRFPQLTCVRAIKTT